MSPGGRSMSPNPGQSTWTGADATVTDMLVSMKADANARAMSSPQPVPRSVSPPPARCIYTDNITSLKASAKAMPPKGNDFQYLVKELRKVITCEQTFLEEHSVFLLLHASKFFAFRLWCVQALQKIRFVSTLKFRKIDIRVAVSRWKRIMN
jgi:hypothetical protein